MIVIIEFLIHIYHINFLWNWREKSVSGLTWTDLFWTGLVNYWFWPITRPSYPTHPFCHPFMMTFAKRHDQLHYYILDASKKSKAGIIIGVIVGVLVLLLLGCVVLFLWRGRHNGYKREIFVDVAGDLTFYTSWILYVEIYMGFYIFPF